MFKIYKILSYIITPIILINLYFRILKNKEDKERYKERFGKNDYKLKFSKKIIWLHAASVGEFKSCDLIIEKFYKDFQILVTTTTKSSAEYIKKYYDKKVTHQYIPFDVPLWCSRFISYWKPSLILWIESDIWPNMLKVIKDHRIKCLYINARLSPKSFNRWKLIKNLYSQSLKTFNKIFVQSPNDLKRIELLTDANIKYIGNLKLSNNKKTRINQNDKKIYKIMIVSSHESEEEIIINNIKSIILNEKLKLCIAPRHLERVKDVSKLLSKYNLSYCLGSEDNKLENDVTIIDKFGDLDTYFDKSEIAILGGSFINKGGHNPLEPAKFGCAIITGHHIFNWQNLYDDMNKDKACIMIENISDLKVIISDFLSNKTLLESSKKKALDFSNKKFFDVDTLFKEINLVLY